MKFKYFLFLLFLSLIILKCNKENKVIKITIGSNYNNNGIITDKNIKFNFIKFKNKKNIQELVNSIYFAGDTICFSILLNTNCYNNINFKAYFIGGDKFILKDYEKRFYLTHKIPTDAVLMERVDFFKNRISGFSLVGSILEHTYKNELTKRFSISIFSKPHYVLYLFIINDAIYKTKLIKFNI